VSATLGRAAFTGRLFPGSQTLAPVDPLILSQTRVTFAFSGFPLGSALAAGRAAIAIAGS
jgi:hypothetical protein